MIKLPYTKKEIEKFMKMQEDLQDILRYRGQLEYTTEIIGYEGKNMMQVGFGKREEVKFKNEV